MSIPRTDKAARAAIYRAAAHGMEQRNAGLGWSCWAICEAAKLPLYGDNEFPPLIVSQYERVFSPHEHHRHLWGEDWDRGDKILALCFMAAMVEAGDA